MRSLAPRSAFTPDSSNIGTMRVMEARQSMAMRLIATCVAGVAVAAISALPALADEPERLGYLVVEPAKGDLLTPIDIATSDVCTRGQMFAVKLDGPNLDGADRGNFIGTTKITTIGPDSYPGHYVVPLPTDLATYIATAAPGQRIKGDYTLTFACRDTLSTADLQVFTATLSIDGKGRYVAQGESATPIDQLIEGYVPGSTGFAYGDPAAPDAEAVAEYAAEQPAAAEQSAGESFPWRTLLIVVGAGLLLGAAYAYWRGRAKSSDANASDEDQPVSAGK